MPRAVALANGLAISMVAVVGVFAYFFGTLMVNAVSVTDAAGNFSAMFNDFLYIIIEIAFLCLIFFMTYIAIRPATIPLPTVYEGLEEE